MGSTNGIGIDSVEVHSRNAWYGVDGWCIPSGAADQNDVSIDTDDRCDAGANHYTKLCIDTQSGDCAPARQMTHFNLSNPDAFESYARWQDATDIAVETETCPPTSSPSTQPTNIPSDTPTLLPSVAPTRDVRGATLCTDIIETLHDFSGIAKKDILNDDALKMSVMNSTRIVIYESVKRSQKYDVDALCEKFWSCFLLELMDVETQNDGRDIMLNISLCAWTQSVYAALRDKISDDSSEIDVHMLHLLSGYLTEAHYEEVTFSNSTQIIIRIANGGETASTSTTTWTTTRTQSQHEASESAESDSSGYAYALAVLCCVLGVVVFLCWRREQTQQRQKEEPSEEMAAQTKTTSGTSTCTTAALELTEVVDGGTVSMVVDTAKEDLTISSKRDEHESQAPPVAFDTDEVEVMAEGAAPGELIFTKADLEIAKELPVSPTDEMYVRGRGTADRPSFVQ